jgi:two-component system sensor histidine kinase BaeS
MIELEHKVAAGFKAVNMSELLRGLNDFYRGPAFEVPDGLPAVQGEANLLSDAIRELLDNAVRFTPDGGAIMLRAQAQGNWLLVEVEDEGTGIAPADLARIFETFWRQDKAHTTRGFGLGLPLVQRVVELHGGHVEVESQPGEGSLFRVVLPAGPLDEIAQT